MALDFGFRALAFEASGLQLRQCSQSSGHCAGRIHKLCAPDVLDPASRSKEHFLEGIRKFTCSCVLPLPLPQIMMIPTLEGSQLYVLARYYFAYSDRNLLHVVSKHAVPNNSHGYFGVSVYRSRVRIAAEASCAPGPRKVVGSAPHES